MRDCKGEHSENTPQVWSEAKAGALDKSHTPFKVVLILQKESLPNNMFYKTYSFSQDELLELEQYLRKNAFLIWEIAKEAA